MDYMQALPDKAYDLAIVDPPYGLSKSSLNGSGKLKDRKLNTSNTDWDTAPEKEYFDELFRVSKNQIIWGGNYFALPPTRCIIVWDKMQPFENFSQVEIAWTSFSSPAQLFQFDNRTGDKIHPVQKPIRLYKWLLHKYAKQDDKILDTHLGSGSSAIACHDYDFEMTGIEISKEYFDKASARIKRHQQQIKLF
jgi:site-specific DNA-methyltransferase (adenine-specific)